MFRKRLIKKLNRLDPFHDYFDAGFTITSPTLRHSISIKEARQLLKRLKQEQIDLPCLLPKGSRPCRNCSPDHQPCYERLPCDIPITDSRVCKECTTTHQPCKATDLGRRP